VTGNTKKLGKENEQVQSSPVLKNAGFISAQALARLNLTASLKKKKNSKNDTAMPIRPDSPEKHVKFEEGVQAPSEEEGQGTEASVERTPSEEHLPHPQDQVCTFCRTREMQLAEAEEKRRRALLEEQADADEARAVLLRNSEARQAEAARLKALRDEANTVNTRLSETRRQREKAELDDEKRNAAGDLVFAGEERSLGASQRLTASEFARSLDEQIRLRRSLLAEKDRAEKDADRQMVEEEMQP